jgi:DNA replication licensing factor MCM7
MYITPRTLLGIIRISQALARLHFRDVIEQPDVDQALKLMDYSIRSLRKIKDESRGKRRGEQQDQYKDTLTKTINDIRTLMNNAAEQQMHVDEIMKRLQRTDPAKYSSKSFNKDNLLDVLNYYKKLSVIYVDNDDNVLFL